MDCVSLYVCVHAHTLYKVYPINLHFFQKMFAHNRNYVYLCIRKAKAVHKLLLNSYYFCFLDCRFLEVAACDRSHLFYLRDCKITKKYSHNKIKIYKIMKTLANFKAGNRQITLSVSSTKCIFFVLINRKPCVSTMYYHVALGSFQSLVTDCIHSLIS